MARVNPGPGSVAVPNTQGDIGATGSGISYTSSTLPAASNYAAGTTAWTSDRGLLVSNGVSWVTAMGNTPAIQAAIPVILAPSSFVANNGVMVIGQAPSNSATASFSATSGTGVTMTMSAVTLLGTAADVGRVLTILDTTYKYATITAQSTTTVATVTITGTLSGTGPFANNTIWLSGSVPATSNTSGFSVPLRSAFSNCYVILPVNALFSGSSLGVYYAKASSTTLLQVFNNVLTNGVPTIPASAIPFVSTGPGAFNQTTNTNIMAITITIAGNSLGPNGSLTVMWGISGNTSAGQKISILTFGAQTLGGNPVFTTNQYQPAVKYIFNKGVTNAQTISSGAGYAAATGAPGDLTVDTTLGQDLVFQLNIVTAATDFVQIDHFSVTTQYAA